MKIRIKKIEMDKALLWYQNKLLEKYYNKLLSPATIELMERDLFLLQNQIKSIEKNPVWTVPIALKTIPSKNYVEIVIKDENNILFIDQDH